MRNLKLSNKAVDGTGKLDMQIWSGKWMLAEAPTRRQRLHLGRDNRQFNSGAGIELTPPPRKNPCTNAV